MDDDDDDDGLHQACAHSRTVTRHSNHRWQRSRGCKRHWRSTTTLMETSSLISRKRAQDGGRGSTCSLYRYVAVLLIRVRS